MCHMTAGQLRTLAEGDYVANLKGIRAFSSSPRGFVFRHRGLRLPSSG